MLIAGCRPQQSVTYRSRDFSIFYGIRTCWPRPWFFAFGRWQRKNAQWVLHKCIAGAVQSFHSSLPMTGSILQPKFCRMWPIFRRTHALSSTLAECVPPALFNLCMPLPRQCQTGEYVVVAPHWHNMVRYVMVAWEKFKTRWGQSALIMHVGCLGRTKCDVHSSIVGNFTALHCNLI